MGKKGWNYCSGVCFPSEGRLRDILWIFVDKAAGKAGKKSAPNPGKVLTGLHFSQIVNVLGNTKEQT